MDEVEWGESVQSTDFSREGLDAERRRLKSALCTLSPDDYFSKSKWAKSNERKFS
jgi:hypothetical protein